MIYIDKVYINDVHEVKFDEDQTPLTGYRARTGGQVSLFSALLVVIAFLISVNPGLPRWFSGKESACQAGEVGSVPSGSPEEGDGNTLQYSCLENPWTEEPGRLLSMGSQKSQTGLSTLRQRLVCFNWEHL